MESIIIGMGEVGTAHHNILCNNYKVVTKDIEKKKLPRYCGVLHICIRYSDNFHDIVSDYIKQTNPNIINICSTVPPGTTEKFGDNACHSTTRGLHPNLESGLKNITKHIGGPQSITLAAYFEKAGIPCITHNASRTTELAHILNNTAYGINLMYAKEMSDLCRFYGVDYYEAVMKYTETNNYGYSKLDHKTKQRMILTPPQKIGGHCVVQSAQLIPEKDRPPLLDKLAKYNEEI